MKDHDRYEHWPRYRTDRRKVSSEGTVGGPCHAVTARGHYCTRRAVSVAADGFGYCAIHATVTARRGSDN